MALVCENAMGRISELSCYSYRATINIPYPWYMGIPLASPRGIGLGAKGIQRIMSPAGLFWTHQSMSLIIVIRWVLGISTRPSRGFMSNPLLRNPVVP